MSLLDRQQGQMDGSAQTARSYGAAINQWEAHSNKLQARLQAATSQAEESAKQRLFAQAQLEGRTALMEALKHELMRVCPSSPLLCEDAIQKNISRTAMADFFKKNGYNYDPLTQQVRKV